MLSLTCVDENNNEHDAIIFWKIVARRSVHALKTYNDSFLFFLSFHFLSFRSSKLIRDTVSR